MVGYSKLQLADEYPMIIQLHSIDTCFRLHQLFSHPFLFKVFINVFHKGMIWLSIWCLKTASTEAFSIDGGKVSEKPIEVSEWCQVRP
jgi:hypothetical protein